jgi:hypothetical protein
MGVDISYHVKFINKKNEVKHEILVSDRDNELEQALSQEEYKIFWFKPVEEDEEYPTESEILDAKEALKLLEQLFYSTRKNLKSFTEKDYFIRMFLQEGYHYYNSLGILMGIVKTAIVMDYKIQLIGEYY